MSTDNPFDTAIYVRVKRFNDTFFVLCDEYEDVGTFKGHLLDYFIQTNAIKMHDDFSIEDIRLTLRNRVTLFLTNHLCRYWTTWPLATTSKYLMTLRSTAC